MADETDVPPDVITPFESAYLRGAAYMILPLVNYLIDATNLDVTFHLTQITQNQIYKFFLGVVSLVGVVRIVLKRIKDGKDPNSAAAKVVLRKPPDEPPAPPAPPAVSA